MKQKIRKGFLYLILGFVVMFFGRLTYGYLAPSEQAVLNAQGALRSALFTSIGGREDGFTKNNYASDKLKVQRGETQEAISVDQKYEKVASVESKTNNFEEDEKAVRDLTGKYSALIQFEKSSGLHRSRRVELAIGVPPDRFEPMVGELRKIGELSSIRIDKTDKTNEFKELKAKRSSLEKTRDALLGLKSRPGRIEELTALEDRILEIEGQIQSTGVRLGDYDQENEFCTVMLSLEEKGAAVPGISFRHRAVVALAWTVKYYTFLLAFLVFGALLTLLVVVILQRLNLIPLPAGQLASAER
jgi:uncharacterized protein DUF4349